jgi:hypothetical protein
MLGSRLLIYVGRLCPRIARCLGICIHLGSRHGGIGRDEETPQVGRLQGRDSGRHLATSGEECKTLAGILSRSCG